MFTPVQSVYTFAEVDLTHYETTLVLVTLDVVSIQILV